MNKIKTLFYEWFYLQLFTDRIIILHSQTFSKGFGMRGKNLLKIKKAPEK